MDLKAVFVDAAGTLLRPREPVGVTYARHARARGHAADPVIVEQRFRALMKAHPHGQVSDGRAYWRPIVAGAVGVEDEALFEALYHHYAQPRAWWVDLDALRVLADVARRGVTLGILSNWDERLRGLYARLALDRMFPVLVCSAEHGVEKPDPWIFRIACRVAAVRPQQAVHIGDHLEHDVDGASRAGLVGLHFADDTTWTEMGEQLRALRRGPPGLYSA